MVATDISIIGHEMSIPHGRNVETPAESGIFVVRFSSDDDDIRATRLMARADPVKGVMFDGKGDNSVNRKQYEELLRSGIPHEVVSAPSSYKPPIVKVRRR
jgi:hypothetical protein